MSLLRAPVSPVACLALLLFSLAEALAAPATQADLVRVVDPATLEVQWSGGAVQTVRLVGVAAPAAGQVACGADSAAARAQQLVAGQPITLNLDSSQTSPTAVVWTADNQNLAEELIRQGAVAMAPDTGQVELAAAQADAIAHQLGIWAPGACAASDIDRAALATYVASSSDAIQRLRTAVGILHDQARSEPQVGATPQWQTTTALAMAWLDQAVPSLQSSAPLGTPAELVQPLLVSSAADAQQQAQQFTAASTAGDVGALDIAGAHLGETAQHLSTLSAELNAIGASYGLGD